jgi:hypothetical protein
MEKQDRRFQQQEVQIKVHPRSWCIRGSLRGSPHLTSPRNKWQTKRERCAGRGTGRHTCWPAIDDGALTFSPSPRYGCPHDLKRRCGERLGEGLMPRPCEPTDRTHFPDEPKKQGILVWN